MATKLRKSFKKSSFFLNGPVFTPPHLNVLASSGGTFFAASLREDYKKREKKSNLQIILNIEKKDNDQRKISWL